MLHQRGIQVSHETLREWSIEFKPLFAEDLRHREPRREPRWPFYEVCMTVDGVRHGLWRAVDEYGFVLDVRLQRHRDTEAAKTILTRLLGEDDVQEVIHTGQLRSDGTAIWKCPSLSLINVDRQQVISTARCNYVTLQKHRSTKASRAKRAGVASRVRSAQEVSRVSDDGDALKSS